MTTVNLKNWFDDWFDQLEQQKAYLSDLDQTIGDGDHGNNMARGAAAAKGSIQSVEDVSDTDLMKKVAMAFMSKVGGASGPLYGSAFLAMSQAFSAGKSLPDALSAGLDKIKALGKSEAGQKTMIDMWAPAIDALQNDTLSEETLDDATEKVTAMKAEKGRASYYGERSIGEKDPGAESSRYLFSALIKELNA
ncbi:MAG: dihydroxyacetone kinase subunit DhaL [Aerococcus sp.]|nr:dihydroxyacetone kinase subunit DhaL [Aerococcus sp.]